MKKNVFLSTCLALTLLWIALFTVEAFAEERLVPKRLSSIGDSITVGMNAELLGENHYASWANGYYGFWQWLFGLTNVNSHNQRITAEFGRWGRRNYMEAESGADSSDFADQAQKAVDHEATYVTVFLGHNDVCNLAADENLLEDNYYEEKFRPYIKSGIEKLKELNGEPTIYVVGLVDISKILPAALWKIEHGWLNCYLLWELLGDTGLSPCGNMLNADAEDIIFKFNKILEEEVVAANDGDSTPNFFYSNSIFNYTNEFGISPIELSDIDCYHPSAYGQSVLSEITWDVIEPFFP